MTRTLQHARRWAAGLAAVAMALATPARADGGLHDSENLRRLDIMLMVTGLRCRNTADDFQADFQAFEARHLAELNAAQRDLVAAYGAQLGAAQAALRVDRLTVQMANRYGNGHPWLGCHDLKGLAQALAAQDGREALLQAASEVVDGDGAAPTQAAVADGDPAPPAGEAIAVK